MPMVLILDDDPLIALDLAMTVEDDGADAVVAGTLVDARKLDLNTLDAAILDVNIGPFTSYAFARLLLDAGVPVAFVSGSQRSDIPADLSHVLFLAKPCSHSKVLEFINHAMPSVAQH